ASSEKSGRAAGIAHQTGKRGRSFHLRGPSAETDDRRISLSGDGRLPPRHHYRSGPTSPESAIATAEVHAGRRNDAGRDGERTTALALRDDSAPRLLQRGRNAKDHCAQFTPARGRDRRGRRG